MEPQYVDTINANGGDIKKAIGNEKLLKNAYKTNIAKINMDTDFRLAYTAAVREYMAKNPSKFSPRDYGAAGINQVKICAIDRIKKICHSDNKA